MLVMGIQTFFEQLYFITKMSERIPATKFCAGKDAFERMNYLFQLSSMCAKGQIKQSEPLARFYAHQLIAISKKTVQRIEPGVKRKICKSCHQYLIAGKTCKIRVKNKVVIHKCLLCHTEKHFLTTPNYMLWNERPEAMAELLDYRNVDKTTQMTASKVDNETNKLSSSKILQDSKQETIIKHENQNG